MAMSAMYVFKLYSHYHWLYRVKGHWHCVFSFGTVIKYTNITILYVWYSIIHGQIISYYMVIVSLSEDTKICKICKEDTKRTNERDVHILCHLCPSFHIIIFQSESDLS